jgi:hypothetical protein
MLFVVPFLKADNVPSEQKFPQQVSVHIRLTLATAQQLLLAIHEGFVVGRTDTTDP